MSGPGAIASLFSSVTLTTVSGSTSISGQMDTVVPAHIISPSDIDKIQYARNVSTGILSVHQIGKVPHAVWLVLEHVAELFGVSGTVAKGSKTSCAAPASRTVTSLGSGTVFACGSRLHATVLKVEEAVCGRKKQGRKHSRANKLQGRLDAALVDLQQLQSTAGTI